MENAELIVAQEDTRPRRHLKTNKSLLRTILLTIPTLGIYPFVVMTSVSTDINTVASCHDGKHTMYFLLMLLLTPLSAGIVTIVWFHNLSNRIGVELRRRAIDESFDSTEFWLWGVLGILLFGIGPLVYLRKLFKAMNLLNADYNEKG